MSKIIIHKSLYGKERPDENASVMSKQHECNTWCAMKKGLTKGLQIAGPLLTMVGEGVSLFAPEIGEPIAMLGLAAEGIEAMIPENDPFNPIPSGNVSGPVLSSAMDVEPNNMNTLRKHSSYNRPDYSTPIQKKVKTPGESMFNPITPGDLERDALKREMLYQNLRGESAPKVAILPNIANSKDMDPKKMTNNEWKDWVLAGAPDAEKYQTPSISSRMLTKGAPIRKGSTYRTPPVTKQTTNIAEGAQIKALSNEVFANTKSKISSAITAATPTKFSDMFKYLK
jgi:hypothetical protein